MRRPDLSRLSPAEKDALILALLDRIAVLAAKRGAPPKTPDNSSLPPSRGPKANQPARLKQPHRKRQGPGVTRVRIFGRGCPGCRRRVRGVPPASLSPGSPFGAAICAAPRHGSADHTPGAAQWRSPLR